ncbi:MAG: arginine deiminase [Gammaproteobacteria bacterium]|nr:arginine deiminase [Gammaproteobacteria bacterium]
MRIESEIGILRKVILHCPELALHRLTPDNCDELLFDDVLWPEKAFEEHCCFENILRSNGVEVYLLRQLLQETLENQEAKKWLLKYTLKRLYHQSDLGNKLYEYLFTMDAKQLAINLCGGLTWDELDMPNAKLLSEFLSRNDFVIPPLPNHYFTRDTSCWIGNGVSINPMYWPARRGETLNIAAIYKFHPMFTQENFNTWLDGSELKSEFHSIEGGDVLVLNQGCVLIGISERTNPQTIAALAHRLFEKGDKEKVIAIEIPKNRASMHLDTVLTMVDHNTFCTAFPCNIEDIVSWIITPGNNKAGLELHKAKDLRKTIAKELGGGKVSFLEISDNPVIQAREQWNDGSNLLTIAPGKVIGYECNIHANAALERAGIEVLTIPGEQLGRGRGGARCMSCPIERDL